MSTDNAPKRGQELQDRTFRFSRDVVMLCARLEGAGGIGRRTAGQLFDAATSVAANYGESRSASSRRDYLHRQEIVLRECRESHYWLRLVSACGFVDPPPSRLVDEASQLVAIFVASTESLKSALPRRH
jgi:four helix bundle protein